MCPLHQISPFLIVVLLWCLHTDNSAAVVVSMKNTDLFNNGSIHSQKTSDQQATIHDGQQPLRMNGYWFNKGSNYEKCPSGQENERDQCRALLLSQPVVETTTNWQPDYGQILRKTICILQKLNCPTVKRSFQLHDIPCQSACLAALGACGGHVTRTSAFAGPQWYIAEGCPTLIDTVSVKPSPYMNNFQPSYTSNPYFFTQNRGQPMYQNEMRSRYPRSGDFHPSRPWRTRYPPYQMDRSRYAWESSFPGNSAQRGGPKFRRGTQGAVDLTEKDCYLLPPGGCDLASVQVGDVNGAHANFDLKVNTGCPADMDQICGAMFPQEFSRRQWSKGEYTVVIVIKISQVIWWFGENDRFQPFFRFHVVETLQSDIHPYDDKMILTYSWPNPCICPGELTVGKTYLLLTHSFKSRQTLNVTNATVFLSRVRRFSKRLACWKGSCQGQRGRNRRRRVPPSYWRFTRQTM